MNRRHCTDDRNATGTAPSEVSRRSVQGTMQGRDAPSPRRAHRRVAAGLIACLALQPLPPLAAEAGLPPLPTLGDPAAEALPLGEERRLGQRLMQQVLRSPSYLDDPVMLAYVEALWDRLLETARSRGDIAPELDAGFAWDLFLIRDRTLNAFALPGGHVGVHLGLLAATGSADEFAAVLAHELTHVSQRHIARGFAVGQRQSAIGTAALLLGLLVAARAGNPEIAQAAVAGSQAAMIQGQLNFSRDMEREADRIGAAIHQLAGFSPHGTAAMFDRLAQAARLNDSGSYAYLRTHPLNSERLADARARLALLPPQPPALTPMHALMQARARVLMDPSVQNWQRLMSAVEAPAPSATQSMSDAQTPAERLGTLYAAALAASSLSEHGAADALARDLARAAIATNPADETLQMTIGWLRVELALARGDGATALALTQAARQSMPTVPARQPLSGPGIDSQRTGAPAGAAARPPSAASSWARPALLLQAAAALGAADPDPVTGLVDRRRADARAIEALVDMRQSLQVWTAEHPGDALAWEWLGRCAQALALPLLAQRAHAERLAAMGDLDAAIDRLFAARSDARAGPRADFIEASIIDVRLGQLIARRRALAEELRGQGTAAPR